MTRRLVIPLLVFFITAYMSYEGLGPAGGGDGTYIPLALAATPLLWIPSPLVVALGVLYLAPLWWGFLAILSRSSKTSIRLIFALIMAIHYVTAVLLALRTDGDRYVPWRIYFLAWRVVPVRMGLVHAGYLSVQILLWRTFLAARAKRSLASAEAAATR